MATFVKGGVAQRLGVSSKSYILQHHNIAYTVCRTIGVRRVIKYNEHVNRLIASAQSITGKQVEIGGAPGWVEPEIRRNITAGLDFQNQTKVQESRITILLCPKSNTDTFEITTILEALAEWPAIVQASLSTNRVHCNAERAELR
eukprot:Selendium_serpulae@DN3251_c0_g1_i2.p2